MNLLSTFNGMGCARIALDKLAIDVDNYYCSDIDENTVKVVNKNYPDANQMGDITKWREWDIDWSSIDLFTGGSPCQGFSFAGKQLAFNDPRSALFFVYLDILNHIKSLNPAVKFLLENVKMKKESMNVISEKLGVEPVFINSALVSAHNRQRYYWTNWEFEQPEDKGILLSDVIESGVVDRDKSYCIDANYWKGGNLKSYFGKSRRQLVFESCDYQNYSIDDAIRVDDSGNKQLNDGFHYRKLTPLECERLQTVPEGYTDCVSNTQRYRMLGNGCTVQVMVHIFRNLYYPEFL
jgi:site-specific DNA-cytosine methylase